MKSGRLISRRRFLKLGVIGAGGIIVVGSTGWLFREELKSLRPSEIAGFLRTNFDYLNLEITDQQLHQFAVDYTRHYRPITRQAWQSLRGRGADEYDRMLNELAGTFLLSTDFFLNGGDESKPVRYVMLYHPYVSPCWNPLAMAGARSESIEKSTAGKRSQAIKSLARMAD